MDTGIATFDEVTVRQLIQCHHGTQRRKTAHRFKGRNGD